MVSVSADQRRPFQSGRSQPTDIRQVLRIRRPMLSDQAVVDRTDAVIRRRDRSGIVRMRIPVCIIVPLHVVIQHGRTVVIRVRLLRLLLVRMRQVRRHPLIVTARRLS